MVVSLHSLFRKQQVLIKKQRTLNYFETRDSVCRGILGTARGLGHETSQEVTRAILTMKSLILAQDER